MVKHPWNTSRALTVDKTHDSRGHFWQIFFTIYVCFVFETLLRRQISIPGPVWRQNQNQHEILHWNTSSGNQKKSIFMCVGEISTGGRRDNRSAHGIYSQWDPIIGKSKKRWSWWQFRQGVPSQLLISISRRRFCEGLKEIGDFFEVVWGWAIPYWRGTNAQTKKTRFYQEMIPKGPLCMESVTGPMVSLEEQIVVHVPVFKILVPPSTYLLLASTN